MFSVFEDSDIGYAYDRAKRFILQPSMGGMCDSFCAQPKVDTCQFKKKNYLKIYMSALILSSKIYIYIFPYNQHRSILTLDYQEP